MNQWDCLKCHKVHENDISRVVLYFTKGTEDDHYLPLFWICEKCSDETNLNEYSINGKIALIKDQEIEEEINLVSNDADECSICDGIYDPYEEYGICIYKEKFINEEEGWDFLDAVQIFNICNNCYNRVNSFLMKGSAFSGTGDILFSKECESIPPYLMRRILSEKYLSISFAIGKMIRIMEGGRTTEVKNMGDLNKLVLEDDSDIDIVDNIHRVDLKFELQANR